NPPVLDRLTGGSVGATALPLLVDAPVDPYEGSTGLPPPVGQNGWQRALPAPSSALPAFPASSAGGLLQGQPRILRRNSPASFTASGGVDFLGLVTPALDNTFYWAMFDFAKTTTVVTAGFVDLLDPHRMPDAPVDPRLGPFFGRAFPAGKRVRYAAIFDP